MRGSRADKGDCSSPKTEHVKFSWEPSFYSAFYFTFVIIILYFLFSLLFPLWTVLNCPFAQRSLELQNMFLRGMCQSLLFNKVAGLRPATFLKKRLWHSCFLVNFAKFLRTPFSQNTSGRLLLKYLHWILPYHNFTFTSLYFIKILEALVAMFW